MALEGSGRNDAMHIEYSSSYSYFDPTLHASRCLSLHRDIVASPNRCPTKSM